MPSKRSRNRLLFLRLDHYRSRLAKRQLVRFGAIVAGLWIVHTFLLSDQSAVEYLRLRGENRALLQQIAAAEDSLETLKSVAAALESDPEAIEKFAREQFRMLAEGETQYIFIDVDLADRERLIREVLEEGRLERQAPALEN